MSTLKLLVDIDCQLYCDYEFVGNITKNSMFRLELRQGKYIISLQIEDEVLYTRDYAMQFNDYEDLVKVSLENEYKKYIKEKEYQQIEKLDVDVIYDSGARNVLRNNTTGEQIVIPYQLALIGQMGYLERIDNERFDECGLIAANDGGEIDYGYGGSRADVVGGKWGCLNKKGEIQIPFIYDWEVFFENKDVTTAKLGDKFYFIDKWGEIVFDNDYDEVKDFQGSWCIVKKEKYGIIDTKGKIVVPCIYDEICIERIAKEYRFLVSINGKWGIINEKYDKITQLIYDSIHHQGYGRYNYFIIKQQEKKGITDINGKVLLDVKYEYIRFNYDSILVSTDGESGVLNLDLTIKIPIEYEFLSILNGLVRRNGKYGIVNVTKYEFFTLAREFEELVPCIYDYSFGNGVREQYLANQEGENIHFYSFAIKEKSRTQNGLAIMPKKEAELKEEFICKKFQEYSLDGHYVQVRYKSDVITILDKQSNTEMYEISAQYGDIVHCNCTEENIIITFKRNDGVVSNFKFVRGVKAGTKMPMYLFIDTETTGLIVAGMDLPRLVQLSYKLVDADGDIVSLERFGWCKGNDIIKPEGFDISKESSAIHGITTAIANQKGVSIKKSIEKFLPIAKSADVIIGHNIDYDIRIIEAELGILAMSNVLAGKKVICTMKSTVDFCKISNGYGYKYPKLQELYYRLFGETFSDAHNSWTDVCATERCFWELKKLGVINVE